MQKLTKSLIILSVLLMCFFNIDKVSAAEVDNSSNSNNILNIGKENLIDIYGNTNVLEDEQIYNEMNRRVNEFTKQNCNFSSEITFAVDKHLVVKSNDHTNLKIILDWTDGGIFGNKPNLTSSAFKITKTVITEY